VLPTFVIIGAMKTGSTSLATYLRGHPQVFMTSPKEPSFFSRRWDDGVEWYESLFDGAGQALARGEASTSYSKAYEWPGVPARMAKVVPAAKLVYLVRHPVERIRSQYVHNAAHRNERRPIDRAVREDPAYIDFSSHARQIELFLEHYDRDRILVVSSEALRDDRRGVVAQVCDFIGVDPSIELGSLDAELNKGVDKRRSPAALDHVRVALNRVGIAQRFPERWRQRAYDGIRFQRIRAGVDADLAAWIRDRLADDERQFRSLVGPDFPMWRWS